LSAAKRSNATDAARPTVEVRADGQLLRRIAPGAAEMLITRGWGEWIGTGRRRYVQLTASAPMSALPGWRGKDGTRPMRGDGSFRYGDGQLLGDPQSHREHIPTT
jgi:hypothetical protein